MRPRGLRFVAMTGVTTHMSAQREAKLRLHERSDAWVATGPIREAVLAAVREGRTFGGIAFSLGWGRPGKTAGAGDGARLKRHVGLMSHHNGRGYSSVAEHLRYDTAVAILRAIDRDPVWFGL
jgi:hypothetical protein